MSAFDRYCGAVWYFGWTGLYVCVCVCVLGSVGTQGQSYGLQVITGSLTVWHAADSVSVRPTCQEHRIRLPTEHRHTCVHARTHTHAGAEGLHFSSTQTWGAFVWRFESSASAAILEQSHATLQVERFQIVALSSLLLFWLSLWPHLTPHWRPCNDSFWVYSYYCGLQWKQGFYVMWRLWQCWKS